MNIFLQSQGAVLSQALIASGVAFDRGKTDDLNLLDAAGAIGHNLTGDVDDAVHHTLVVAIIGIEQRLALVEMNKEGIFLLTKDAGTVVRTVVRDMLHHGILLLQLTGTSLEIGNGSQGGSKRLDNNGSRYRCLDDGLQLKNRLFHLTGTTWDVKDDIQSGLRYYGDFLLGAKFRTTVCTLIAVVLIITNGSTDECLKIPMTTQRPGITVKSTNSNEVALLALVTNGLPETQWEGDGTYVVMGIDSIETKEMMHIHRISPIA